MSHAETLSPYTRPRNQYGPTQTKTTTLRFEQALRGVLGRTNAAIREAVVSEDILGLRRAESMVDAPDLDRFEFTTDAGKRREFLRWLRRQIENELLTVVTRDSNPYIRRAYDTGLRTATRQLRERGLSVDAVDLDDLVESGRFDTGLQTLYERAFDNLRQIGADVEQAVREELAEGFAEGVNPTKMAQRITGRVDAIGKHRATLLARTETINAHTQGTIDRIEKASRELDIPAGVRHVGRVTAADADVCPWCRRLSDAVFTLSEFTTTQAQWRGRVWRVAPPSHPNCRCSVQVELGVDSLPPIDDRLPAGATTI